MKVHDLDLDERMQSFINWYQGARHELSNESYNSSATGLRSVLHAYKDLNSPAVLRSEIKFQSRAVEQFRFIFSEASDDEVKAYLPRSVLALKNRAEFLSEKADFFPVFGTTVVFLTALVSTIAPPKLKFLLGCVSAFFILWGAFRYRVLLRAKAAHVKELANLLEFIKGQIGDLGKTPAATNSPTAIVLSAF